jgi:hypothetical protein
MTGMTGIVDGVIPSTDGCLTLHCPRDLISVVDTSFRAFLFHSYRPVNTETKRNRASDEMDTRRPPSSETLRLIVTNGLRQLYQDVRCARKLIAKSIGISPNSAKQYLTSQRMPNGWNLVQLMAGNPALRADVDRLINELKAAQTVNRTTNKLSNTGRRDNADYWLRGGAQAHMGCCQTWRHEGVALRPSLDLVGSWPGLGRVGEGRGGIEERALCASKRRAGGHRVEG